MSSFEQAVMAGRTYDFTVPLYEVDGRTPVSLAAEDVVLVRIGRGGVIALQVSSISETANKSLVTVTSLDPAVCNVHLAQDDLAGLRGAYDMEVLVQDSAETAPANASKTASVGVLHVIGPSLEPAA
jgi:hypothetical protein